MDPHNFRRAWEIASAALDVDASQRQATVEAACGGDADLLREVRSLLDHSTEAAELPPPSIDVEGVPDRIADYAIIRRVGMGGMGVVYEAVQDTPSRRVALKLMRSGQMAPDLVRRFEYEVEVLASLQHPGITQVFDAGTFDIGSGPQPYFAMEYIEGEPLDEYVLRCHPTRNQRLALLAKICDAVHHAHQKGVIHRDLKPDNVLVTGAGEPKVFDFGVARAIGQPAEDLTMLTDVGRIVGTLAYMSPEQVQGRRDDMTASSDVWSLGVIAYELLAGELPFDIRGKDVAAAARVIVDEEPVPLGKRDRSLRGDIEVVVGTAIDKDPARRYHSAAELATDLRRVIESRPIVARSTSAFYQLRKFTRRNRALSLTAVALLGTVAVSFAWTLYQNRLLDESVDELRRLADSHVIDELNDQFPHLSAARDEDAAALLAWYAKGREVVSRRALHERTLAVLRERARPNTDADLQRSYRRHPLWDERQMVADRIDLATALLGANPSADREQGLAALQRRAIELDAELGAGRPWYFTDSTDQWAHDTLVNVLEQCEQFADPVHGPFTKVGQWLEIVPHLTATTIDDHAAAWAEAIDAIGDEQRSPAYGGLRITPQLGLVPLGRDPRSGLWEFGHPQTGPLPTRDAAGELVLTDDFGLVFVLLPAGSFRMGARRPDAAHPLGAPNVDPDATADEDPVHEVSLDAFFISKYEMTKSQWEFFSGRRDGQHRIVTVEGDRFTPRDPVETVHWVNCDEVTRALGLMLPTEAQWEYAARGGTTTVRWAGHGIEALRGAANLYDRTYMRAQPADESDDPVAWSFDDGAVHVTAVGRWAPNPFGLHDLLGNVDEWCRDTPVLYPVVDGAGDGLLRGGNPSFRMTRGGSYRTNPRELRVSKRSRKTKWTNVAEIGLRPARALRPAP